MSTAVLRSLLSAKRCGCRPKICPWGWVHVSWLKNGLDLSCWKLKYRLRLGALHCQQHGRSITCSILRNSSWFMDSHEFLTLSLLITVTRNLRWRLLLLSARLLADSNISLDGRDLVSLMILGSLYLISRMHKKKLNNGNRRLESHDVVCTL